MSRITPREKTELRHIWEDLHLNGRSQEAALYAYHRLFALDAQQQPGLAVELARQVVVTANSAFRRNTSLTRALPFAEKAARTIHTFYPVGASAEEAREKKKLWERAYSKEHVYLDHEGAEQVPHPEKAQEESTLITLRDVLHFSRELEHLFQDGQFAAWSKAIIAIIHTILATRPNDRFALIFLTEEAPFDDALVAYSRYLELFHEHPQEPTSLDQFLTVSARLIARAVGEKNLALATTLAWKQFQELRAFPAHHPSPYKLALSTNLRELGKRLRQLRNKKLSYTSPHAQYRRNPAAFPAPEVHSLLQQRFVALSSREVLPLELGTSHR